MKIRIVDVTVRENLGNRMAYRLADAQLTLRAASGGTLLLMTGHYLKSQIIAITRESG
ncbi:hypothetical protein AAFX91_12260 [Bradyrhizobium sp. 31Argb]|uniref:hypothetical protein n=1 Tax=unclassified Bradyrhizobium TaxID=2631580 RepID=UPI001FDFAED4|nr:hypothetical protein [Bradyrhizobium sp. Leo170]